MKSSKNNALKKEYLDKIKYLLPVFRKNEKDFLHKLELNIDEILENEDVAALSAMDDYYRTFGDPGEIVRQYYSTLEPDSVFSIIRFRKITLGLIFAVCMIFIATIMSLCIILWQQHRMLMREEMVFLNYEIQNTVEENE